MIGETYGVFNLSCDYCGEMADEDFDTFQDAVDYAKRYGWGLRRQGNEWENICPECLDPMDELPGDNDNAIKIENSYIKCDYCDYCIPKVTPEVAKQFINKPCPICGHNLLTRREYLLMKGLLLLVDILNLTLKPDEGVRPKRVRVTSNKDGLIIKEED